MKKIIIGVLLILVIFSCGFKTTESKKEIRGIFISYIDEKNYLTPDISESKKNIDKIISNVKKDKFNLIILQVRANADALYNSKIYPFSSIITGEEGIEYFDVLKYFEEKCLENGLELYAWINPYRIRTTEDISSITEKNPSYKYLNSDYIYINNGIYFNPSKQEVEDLIVKGVEEIVTNYKVNGILFDDYFYPSDDIDIIDYENYLKSNPYIDFQTYHLNTINKMVKRVYDTCHENNVLFGISPDGNIENNYAYLYADIYKWVSETGYIDFIMPQIYYGFFNETMPFYNVIREWDKIITNKNIELIIALALYKSGNIDNYAKSGREEWIKYSDIIKRQIILSRNLKNYSGFALFRYDYMYNEELQNDNVIQEIKKIQEILN